MWEEVCLAKTLPLRALVVDDEQVIADTLALILNLNGFTATAVHRGESAVDTARWLMPEVMVRDVIMGKTSGIDAAIQIREAVPSCKVILISGQSRTVDLWCSASENEHGFEILAKPVPAQLLLERLRTAVQSV